MYLKYLPNVYHFELDRMELGSMLAALDNNYNAQREQATSLKDKKRYKIAYRKVTKKFVARKVLVKKNYSYMQDMLKSSLKRADMGKKRSKPTKRAFMSLKQEEQEERRPGEETIESTCKHSRFNKTETTQENLKLTINTRTLETTL